MSTTLREKGEGVEQARMILRSRGSTLLFAHVRVGKIEPEDALLAVELENKTFKNRARNLLAHVVTSALD